ncbi:MAG: CTP synthase, partial [Candidatus Vogelbacteria bacterium CG10_big_fil_rev_8_21_14_0_10_45_14]
NILGLPQRYEDGKHGKNLLSAWKAMVARGEKAKQEVRIALVGKYFKVGDYLQGDVYISVIEALKHAANHAGRKIRIDWLDASDFDNTKEESAHHYKKNLEKLKDYDGILVPGGFGKRAVEGKINVVRYAREHKIPYFGLCYGMQLMVVEFARNVLNMEDAHTTEIEKRTAYRVVDLMPEQMKNLQQERFGGSMRLGAYHCIVEKGTIARECYKYENITERHRHRYEINPDFIEDIEKAGLCFSGKSPDGRLMEIVELPKSKHPFFLGTQFHPEFKTSPLSPHPLFVGFIRAAILK